MRFSDTLEPHRASGALRRNFLGWQCRIRQLSVREYAGYPLPGMKPRVALLDDEEVADAITVLLLRAEPEESTELFRHIVRRTHDPVERHEAAIKMLSAVHYQHPSEFTDVLTALFAADSVAAATLVRAGRCVLTFQQFNQRYRLICVVSELGHDEPAWQATYWHNRMFNDALPGAVRILAFTPEWSTADVDPAPRDARTGS
jgi:hypothetical protein